MTVLKMKILLQSEAAERRRLLIRLKAKLQLGEVLEGGNLVLGLVHRPCNRSSYRTDIWHTYDRGVYQAPLE